MYLNIAWNTAGLLGYWRLDEEIGQIAIDQTGTADGQIGNSPIVDQMDPIWTNPHLAVNLGVDTIICDGGSVLLGATIPNSTYLWQDGTASSTFNVVQDGLYSVAMDNGYCIGDDQEQLSYEQLNVSATYQSILCLSETFNFCDNSFVTSGQISS